MKILATLALIIMSATTMASQSGTFTQEDANMTTALLKTCPLEAAALFEEEGFTRAMGGNYFGGLTPNGVTTIYHFDFETRKRDGSIEKSTVTAVEKIKSADDITVECTVKKEK